MGKEDCIRKGFKYIRTGTLGEQTPAGSVINLVDMTQWDSGDERIGIVLNDLDWSKTTGSNIAADTRVYYIDLDEAIGAEVLVTEANSGAIADGERVAVTTAGKVIEWDYADSAEATDTYLNKLGVTVGGIAQNSNGWLKVNRG